MNDYEIFIIWNSAKEYENEIIGAIQDKFVIVRDIYVSWSKERFTENLTTFYETDLRLNVEQIRMRGNGDFRVLLIEDNNPHFCIRKLNREICDVNENVYCLKDSIRKNTTGKANVHASLNASECQNNLIKLFGLTLEEMISPNYEKFTNYKGDCLGVGGWNSLNDVFKVLNNCFEYVVLRGGDNLIDDYKFEIDGDIDILVNDLPRLSMVLQPSIDRKNNYCFLNWLNIGEERVPIHAKFIGDNYYDEKWQKRIMQTRRWNGKFWVPDDEMLFWTLMCHGLFHKDNYLKYEKILCPIAKKLGLVFSHDKESMISQLVEWMRQKGYNCSLHLDGSAARLNRANIPKDLLADNRKFYCYKSYLDGVPIKTLILCNELIRENPVLFTEIIREYDPLYRIESHILPNSNSLWQEFNQRAEGGELLWQYSIRNGSIISTVFSQKKGEQGKFDKFLIGQQNDNNNDNIDIILEKSVQYFPGRTVDYLIILNFIVGSELDFIKEIRGYLKEVFDKFSFDEECLYPIAWDMLSHNCVKTDNKYYFFDMEMESQEKVKKSEFIAYEVNHLYAKINDFDPQKMYVQLCEEFCISAENYNSIVSSRLRQEHSIVKYDSNVDYFSYKRYMDMQLADKEEYSINSSIDVDILFAKVNNQWAKYFMKNNVKDVVIYGIGKYGKILLGQLESEPIEIVACCDLNVHEYKNYLIINNIFEIPPSDIIIVAIVNSMAIKQQLVSCNYKNVITIEELLDEIKYL